MNGVTLNDPFKTDQTPKTEKNYDFDQSLNALLAKNYAPNDIVEIMGSAGFDSYDVATSLNKKYDDQRRQMWNDRKALQDQLKAEAQAYENILKKKDTALVQDGEESVFGLDLSLSPDEQAKTYYDGLDNDQKFDQFGILSREASLEKIKTEILPTFSQPEVDPVAQVDSRIGSINLIDDLALEAYSNHTAAFQLKNAIAANDTEKIIELIEYFNAQGQLTEFPTTETKGVLDFLKNAAWSMVSPVTSFVSPERDQETESFSEEFLSSLDKAVTPIVSQAKEQQSNVINMVNDFNFRNGISMQYNPSSEIDYDLFMRSSVNRTLSREQNALEEERKFMYDFAGLSEEERKDPVKQKEAEDKYYNTYSDTFFGNLAAMDRARGTWGDWWEEWQNNLGLALNPLVAATWGEDIADSVASDLKARKRNIDQRARDRQVQLARDFDITLDQLEMPIDQRFSETINGNISMGDFFATTYNNTAEIMSDALISSAEFMIPYVGPAVVGIDVYSQNYADVVTYQPHMGTGEAILTSSGKAVAEVLMEKLMFTKGLGSVGALKNVAENFGAKKIIKETGKKEAVERGLIRNVVGRYLLPEGIEEGLISMTGQVIDMVGDVSAGRNVRALNTYEVSDAFWAGMVGAVGPSSISTFTSNIGHTQTMEDRLKIVNEINDLKNQIANETNPDLKEKQEELLIKAMRKMKVVAADEAALYNALNPKEVKTILSINQELSQIRDNLKRGKFWTKESVSKEEAKVLEERMKDLYKKKAVIENAAVARKQKEVEEGERSTTINQKEAAKKKETPRAAEPIAEDVKEEQETKINTDVQVKSHIENGGSTFLKGVDQGGQPVSSVSIFPERSRLIDGKEITKEDLDKYIEDNQDLLKGNNDVLAVGTWFDEKSGKTYLDISAVVPHKNAIDLGKQYNQKSVFNLETYKEVDTGGTGEAIEGLKPELGRVDDIRALMPKAEQDVTDQTDPLVGAELFYTEVITREIDPDFSATSRKDKSVKVDGYSDYVDLWVELTGNGKEASRMQDVFYIKDGKRYDVQPPQPKVDDNGDVVETPLPKTFRQKMLDEVMSEEQTQEETVGEQAELPKELTEEIDEGVFEKYTGTNPFRKVLNNVNKLRKRYFTSKKMLPATAARLIELESGAYASHLKDVEFNMKEFYSMVEKYKGNKETLLDDYDSALRGDTEAFNRLPDDFAVHMKKLRNQIDALSLEAINIGVFDTSTEAGRKTAETVMGKLGSYLMRSYEIYDNKDWANQVSAEVITAAKNRVRTDIKKSAETEYANDPAIQERFDSFEDYLEDRVDGLIKKYLNKATAKAFVKGKALLGKGSDISKKLTDIPVEIRALMGEYSDPMKNYAMSIIKLAKAVEGTRTMNQLREAGLNKFLFKNPTGQFTAQLASEGSETMRPLNGLYTTPEILEAFESTPMLVESFLEKYLMYTSSIKWAKTIGSVATHSKNVLGNLGFMWANGHTDLSKMAIAYTTIKNDLKKGGDAAARARLKKYIELGLTNQNVAIREINEMFGSDNLEAAMLLRSSKQRSVKKTIASIKQVADDLYQAEDDFFKIVAFENEIARYSDALFNKPYESLTEVEQKALDEYLANKVVKQTYPSYDRVPEGVRLPSKIWLGNFVSFVAESYRVSFNTLAIAAKEIKSDNPKLRAIGKRRFAGAFSYLNAKNIIVATFGKLAGVGAMGLLGVFLDDEDEKKRQKALKNYVAPWSVNSDLIILELADGKFTYVDLSASDPFGSLSQIANAMTKDGLSIESFADGIVQAVAPFVDPDIGTRRLMNIIYNQDDYGKPIYNKEAPMSEQIEDITMAIYEVLEVGTLTSVRKIYESEDTVTELLGQISGLKPYTIDVNKAFGYKMARYRTRIADARKLKYDDIDSANAALQSIYQEIYEDAEAAQALGVSFSALRETMMQWGGLGKETSKDILLNRYRPLTTKR